MPETTSTVDFASTFVRLALSVNRSSEHLWLFAPLPTSSLACIALLVLHCNRLFTPSVMVHPGGGCNLSWTKEIFSGNIWLETNRKCAKKLNNYVQYELQLFALLLFCLLTYYLFLQDNSRPKLRERRKSLKKRDTNIPIKGYAKRFHLNP